MGTAVTTGGTARVQTDEAVVLGYLAELPSASEALTPWDDWAELRGELDGVAFYDCSEAAARWCYELASGI